MKINKQHLPLGHKKRRGVKIHPSHITIHATGNGKSTAQNERDYLTNPINTNGIAYHYVVGDNIIIEVMPPNEKAYHAGNIQGNNKSIGIEMVETGDREKVIANTIFLVKELQKQFSISDDRVVRHYDWSGKNCPRILNYGNWQGWQDFKRLLSEVDIMKEERVREIIKEELAKKPYSDWALPFYNNMNKKFPGIMLETRLEDYVTRGELMKILDVVTGGDK